MLYDKTLLLLREAEEAIKSGDIKTKVEALSKADKILRVLNSSLDMEKGGEIAKNLRDIYNFVTDALVIVNSKNDLKMLSDIIEILSTLKEGWEGIKNKV